MNENYHNAARLLLEVAPVVFKHPHFILKGGTAINLFVRNMPRLSIDLDVVFANHTMDRNEALEHISSTLESIRTELENKFNLRCELGAMNQGSEVKLFVESALTRVKIEVNHVFRGTILPPTVRPLAEEAQEIFFTDIALPILHPEELYGSKLVAVMDRQHPRDLFDALCLINEECLNESIVECFVCYLAGHNRPVHEVLFANLIDIAPAFTHEFEGMTRETVSFDQLLELRKHLFADLPEKLTDAHRQFLLGLVKCQPDWSLMKCNHLQHLPAIRWKLENLNRLRHSNPKKFSLQAEILKEKL
ncbi:MAG: nucleotidyl transferase AbiEii/AbiGii toxin family protein [Verrucomicrobia bacterium]|jgi:predicted nucleotidyltransferase component of viral defense system|nr:nucleotidyl transferase AbiEii/AbiGii toxin family protein [Verrucomicrobiota bacterium]